MKRGHGPIGLVLSLDGDMANCSRRLRSGGGGERLLPTGHAGLKAVERGWNSKTRLEFQVPVLAQLTGAHDPSLRRHALPV